MAPALKPFGLIVHGQGQNHCNFMANTCKSNGLGELNVARGGVDDGAY